MPSSRRSPARRAYLRLLAILLLASGGFPVGNAGNARHAAGHTPTPGIATPVAG